MERTRNIFIAIFTLVAVVIIGLLMGFMWNDLQRIKVAGAEAIALSTTVADQAATLTIAAQTTPQATATPLPTATPPPDRLATTIAEAAATAVARPESLVIAKLWPVQLRDAFDNNDSGWATDPGDIELSDAQRRISEGVFQWDITAKGGFTWVEPLPDAILSDRFYVSLEIEQTFPHVADQGLAFNFQDSQNYYLFSLCQDSGKIGTYRRVDGDWITVQGCRSTPILNADEPNTLAVIGQDGYFQFFINDQFVSDLWDRTFENGQVALYVEVDAGDEVLFRFDELKIHSAELGR